MSKEILSEKESLIKGWEKRITHQRAQLAKTQKFHLDIERKMAKRIRDSVTTLKALKS